jgi:hypothetical protein
MAKSLKTRTVSLNTNNDEQPNFAPRRFTMKGTTTVEIQGKQAYLTNDNITIMIGISKNDNLYPLELDTIRDTNTKEY